jgi:diguanylate cyclase (GGDEF)-like protein
MDYPVLVNPGKPSKAASTRMRMKKKKSANASGAAKRRKTGAAARKGAPRRTQQAAAARPAAPNDSRPAVRRLRSELAQALARIEELKASADTDFLLDILNRRGFERELSRSIAFIKRYHASGALIVLDVDRLKPINDEFGHAAGDQVLKAIVVALLREVRASDVVGRLGGDEFAVLLWNLSETDARAKAATLEQTIDALSFEFRGRTVTSGASAGVAVLDSHSDPRKALEEADSAMYVRKAQRRHEPNGE